MWDGEVHVSGRDVKLGRVIIIIAGSGSKIRSKMDEVRSMKINDAYNNKSQEGEVNKIPDLLSRINGGVLDIPDLDLITAIEIDKLIRCV